LIAARALRAGLAPAVLALPLAGCLAMSLDPPYPVDWAAPANERVGACPSIAGRYLNAGRMHLEAGASCEPRAADDRTGKGLWECSLKLSDNLDVAIGGPTVALSQPDEDTLEVAVDDEHGVRIGERRLRRGQDYQCDHESLFFSGTGSALGGPGSTALGVLFLSGGVNHHSRAFVRNAAGELVMSVRQRTVIYHRVFGASNTTTNHVRWRPADAAPAAAGAAR
jgi:hypothetical protein